jgi:3-hydroxyisobutyrate dehydrogenase-like beta-hydroxyacid dehydrogenase
MVIPRQVIVSYDCRVTSIIDPEGPVSKKELRVGFIGIGAMGTPMAHNILKAGFPLTVCDRLADRTAPFAALGVPVAASCAATAAESDVVITMIGQVAEQLEAVLGPGGVLEGAHPGLTLIDSSTVGIVATRRMAQAARDKGVAFLDATVSGSVGPAKQGSLQFMVGGEAETLEAVEPLLLSMAEKVHHVGPNGAGSAMKVVINLMIGMTVLTVAEALTLARQAGLDPQQTLDILGQTSVRSPHLTAKGKMMIEGQFEPAFALKYMQKDFDLVMEAAHALKMPLFTSAIAHQVYTAANVAGYGELDYSSVVRFLEIAAAQGVSA